MKRFITIISLCVFAAGMSTAQDMNITGAGARAEGLGGAFIGVADDATAIVWNPAGLTQLERAEASVVTRFLSEKTEYTNTFSPSSNASQDQSHAVFNFGSLALPFKIGGTSVVIAAAYQRQLDFYQVLKTQAGDQETKGGVETITPAISLKLSPVISIGASANIWTGTYDLTSKPAGFTAQTITENLKYKGFNMAIGALVDLESLPQPVPIKFGVTVRTPFELTADGSVNYDPAIFTTSGTTSTVNENQTVQMPLMLGFGTSVRLSENFTVAADYEMRSYGDREVTNEYVGFTKTTEPISASKENLNQVRVGAEYLFVSKSYVIPLRVGYKTMPTVYANYDNDLNSPSSQLVGKAYSVGSGYIANAFAIDVAYTMADYTQNYGVGGTVSYKTNTMSASLIVYL